MNETAENAIARWAEQILDDSELGAKWAEAQAGLDQLRFQQALRRRWEQARAAAAVAAASGTAQLVGARMDPQRLRAMVMAETEMDPAEQLAYKHWQAWTLAIEQWPALGAAGAQLGARPEELILALCAALGQDPPAADSVGLQVALACLEGSKHGIIRSGIIVAELARQKEYEVLAVILGQTALVTSFVDPTGLACPAYLIGRDPLGFHSAIRAYQRADVASWLKYWVTLNLGAVKIGQQLANQVQAGSYSELSTRSE